MRRFVALTLAAVAACTLIAADLADAARLGGGRSFGAQRNMPAPSAPSVAPPGAATNPVMPAQPGTNLARPAAPAAGAAAAAGTARTGMSRWLAPIAGLAAGLGLAALLSHFGLSEAFATFLLLALIVVGGIFLLRLVLARRRPDTGLRYAGATAPAPSVPKGYETQVRPAIIGERIEPVIGHTAATPPATAHHAFPPGFEPEPFLAQARMQFKRLQAAYDSADRRMLADVLTPEMLVEVTRELDGRGPHVPTEVVALDAEILDVATEGDRHWASVRFHGSLREDGAREPQHFDEAWNLVKPVDGSTGWQLAGIRQVESSAA